MTDVIAFDVRNAVDDCVGARLTSLGVEIQDHYRFLLVRMSVAPSISVGNALKTLEKAAVEVARRVPARSGEYAWMVNLEVGGEVLRSTMGGWRGHPAV